MMVKIPCTKGKFAMVDVEDANDVDDSKLTDDDDPNRLQLPK